MSNAETLTLLMPVPCKTFSILRYKGDNGNKVYSKCYFPASRA